METTEFKQRVLDKLANMAAMLKGAQRSTVLDIINMINEMEECP